MIDSQVDLRHDLLRYNLLQAECGLWVPVDFRTIGHLIPDCTKHYRRSSRTYLERTAMGAVGDCTVLILRDFGCCVSHSSVLIVRPLSMAATSRWLIDVSFCRAIFFDICLPLLVCALARVGGGLLIELGMARN